MLSFSPTLSLFCYPPYFLILVVPSVRFRLFLFPLLPGSFAPVQLRFSCIFIPITFPMSCLLLPITSVLFCVVFASFLFFLPFPLPVLHLIFYIFLCLSRASSLSYILIAFLLVVLVISCNILSLMDFACFILLCSLLLASGLPSLFRPSCLVLVTFAPYTSSTFCSSHPLSCVLVISCAILSFSYHHLSSSPCCTLAFLCLLHFSPFSFFRFCLCFFVSFLHFFPVILLPYFALYLLSLSCS